MSLKKTMKKTDDIDEVLKKVGLKDETDSLEKPAKEKKNVITIKNKASKKVVRLSIEVPVLDHTKFYLVCKDRGASMQQRALELIQESMKDVVIKFES